jgi:hypothetical protein
MSNNSAFPEEVVASDTLVAIPGNTYPVRDELKTLGATWDKEARTWRIAPEKLVLARAVVENQGKAAPETHSAAKREAVQNTDVASMEDPFEDEATGSRLVAITGNTYPVKDALKAIGATWNTEKRTWMISEAKAEYARAIVAGESGSDTASPQRQ